MSDDARSDYGGFITCMIEDYRCRRVCEVSGGANPLLSIEFTANQGLDYFILDISQEELDKAPNEYQKICFDIAAQDFNADGNFDLVFSRMLAEHIPSGRRFHQNIHQMLRSGGRAVHFFPTLYALPFLVNRLLPEALTEHMLNLVQAGREKTGNLGKFPAYYSWCRGPSKAQIDRFRSIGYTVEQYVGFFGHSGYYKKVPILERLHHSFCRWLVQHPISRLTSFALVILLKN